MLIREGFVSVPVTDSTEVKLKLAVITHEALLNVEHVHWLVVDGN